MKIEKLPQDLKGLFSKAKNLTKKQLRLLEDAANELDNDPEFVKEYQEDLQKELDLYKKNQ